MKKIGLITALDIEVPDQIKYNKSRDIQIIKNKENEIGLIVSGVGQKNAIEATKKLCREYKPDIIFFLGFCGGVLKDCNACDLFLADGICYNGKELQIDKQSLEFVKQKLVKNKINFCIGRLQTFDDVVLSKKDVSSDVIGVEMESYGAVEEAKKHNIPMILIRTVSDIVPEKKPFFAIIKAQRQFIRNIKNAKKSLNIFYKNVFLQ